MAIFTYKCPEHGEQSISQSKGGREAECPICGKMSKRVPKIGTVRVVEVIDNGIQERSLERLANAEELRNERIASHEKRLTEE